MPRPDYSRIAYMSPMEYQEVIEDVRRLEQALEEIKAFGDAYSRTVAREALNND